MNSSPENFDRIVSQLGKAFQLLVDTERTLRFDSKDRLTAEDKYKLHNATGEAEQIAREALTSTQWTEIQKLVSEMYRELKAKAGRFDPDEWTYSKSLRRVLRNVSSHPTQYLR
ncbi:hypothetical protein [Roseimaritima ulvae]|uniref:Uncharacterized protein n=1 Tax=Roseimaritima ulvae TaxID=980254 RepID=A0A5B9R1Z5_9BACT|nr:hypothetical protein [Roseimaritima ulvae]QEG43446.1 hypothetical protein UC8_54950 [Roseimaritima ulvae]